MSAPFARAQVKIDEIERELKKSNNPQDRLRMERVLMAIPKFKLWLALSNSILLAKSVAARVVDWRPCMLEQRPPCMSRLVNFHRLG